jgi:uncharacterized protein YegL
VPDPKGNLLPVYVVADESASMAEWAQELNKGLVSLYEALRSQPMIAAKLRLTILGFSDDVEVRLAMADMRNVQGPPRLTIRSSTNYEAVFEDLLRRIPRDVNTLKSDDYIVHRPAVFFLSDGQPNDSAWIEPHQRLTSKARTPAAPNIIACGVGDVTAETILQVATQQEFALVAIPGTDIGSAIAKFFVALTASIVKSGSALNSSDPKLVVEKPETFTLAIDVL